MSTEHTSPNPVTRHPEVVFINPWGNMCDYYQALNRHLDLASTLVRLKVLPLNLLRPTPFTRSELDEHINYQILRREGKLKRKSRWPNIALAIHKVLYRLQFRAYFHLAADRYRRLNPKCVCVWNGHRLREKAAVVAARHLGLPVLFFENGYLPNTTLIDSEGVNSACSLPRNPAFYKDKHPESHCAYEIKTLDIREPIKSKQSSDTAAIQGDFIFVPFQVDLDSQLLINSPHLKNMRDFYQLLLQLAQAHPALTFVIKEHPSCLLSYRDLHHLQTNIRFSGENTEQLIRKARAILTINSSVGMEAIIFHKPVITLGKAFYNIPGLVLQAETLNQISNCIESIYFGQWQPDKVLIAAFIGFLQSHYLVPVAWRRADENHFKAMSARIQNFINAPPNTRLGKVN